MINLTRKTIEDIIKAKYEAWKQLHPDSTLVRRRDNQVVKPRWKDE